MAEVDSALTVTGGHRPVTLLEVFEDRRQLIGYYFMWSRPARRHPVRGPRAAAGRALRGSSLLQLGALAGLVNDVEQAA